jgi:hypothetical protein
MTDQEKAQFAALVEIATEFVKTLTSFEIADLLAGRKQIALVEACPRCRHTADNPWAHCKCLYEECVCAPAATMAAGPSLWRQEQS